MSAGQASPFSPRAVLGLVLFGGVVFVLLLWMLGNGMASGDTNNGGGHAGGKGLNGYAALDAYLVKRGFETTRVRSEGGLDKPGLLILTPPQNADGQELTAIVEKRRLIGPTLVITPKWVGMKPDVRQKTAKTGWVNLAGPSLPRWAGFYDDITLEQRKVTPGAQKGLWSAANGRGGAVPLDPRNTEPWLLTGSGANLVPLVVARQDGRMLAGWINDGGMYPDLEDMSFAQPQTYGEDEDSYPVVFVFEPDLFNNWGMARRENAQLAEALVRAMMTDDVKRVSFDLTLNGLGRSPNLLTLAFTPPFLAATLCLLMAALAVGWRAFLRFGPPRTGSRAIAFGKRALVANAAGLIRRTGRLHLVAPPYADHARDRIVRALALPRMADAAAAEAAIDRAVAARMPGAAPFSLTAARLRAARRPHDMVQAAKDLHALERMLTR
jgi:hypothetical protein